MGGQVHEHTTPLPFCSRFMKKSKPKMLYMV
jgi:hypothetical protein